MKIERAQLPKRVRVSEARVPKVFLRFCIFSTRKLPEENRRYFQSTNPKIIKNPRGQIEFIGEELDVWDAEVLFTAMTLAFPEIVKDFSRRTITEKLIYRGPLFAIVRNLPSVGGKKKKVGSHYRKATERSIIRMRNCTIKITDALSPNEKVTFIEEGPIRKAYLRDQNGFLKTEIYIEFSDWVLQAFHRGLISIISFEVWRRLSGIGKAFYLLILGQRPSFKRTLGNLMEEIGTTLKPSMFYQILSDQLKILKEMGVLDYEVDRSAPRTKDWVVSWQRHTSPSITPKVPGPTSPKAISEQSQ